MTRNLTPYDTGEILEPQLHPDHTGKVDFDNDEAGTELTLSVRPSPEDDTHVIEVEGVEPENVAIRFANGATVTFDATGTPVSTPRTFADDHEWHVAWNIDGYGSSPEQAAAKTWVELFGRTVAGDEDACVFTVTDPGTNKSVTVDLSKFDLETLID